MTQTFKCLNCGADLGRVEIIDGRTALTGRTSEEVIVRRAEVECLCGAVRKFYSIPEGAVRLAEWVERTRA